MIPLWCVIIVGFCVTGWAFRRAYKSAQREARLNKLRSRPMPRFNESGARFPWGDL